MMVISQRSRLIKFIIGVSIVLFTSFRLGWAAEEGTPTVFIHGIWADGDTFKTMIEDYTKNGGVKKLTEILVADKQGRIYSTERYGDLCVLKEEVVDPLIIFIIEDNGASIDQQIKWFEQMIKKIEKKFSGKQLNIVGHSMGGILGVRYILEQGGEDINKLVTIGSPILGSIVKGPEITKNNYNILALIEKNIFDNSPALYDLEETSSNSIKKILEKKSFNENVRVLSIAGTKYGKTNRGDGVVREDSALGLESFVNSISVYSIPLGHLELTENKEVIQRIRGFLWEE